MFYGFPSVIVWLISLLLLRSSEGPFPLINWYNINKCSREIWKRYYVGKNSPPFPLQSPGLSESPYYPSLHITLLKWPFALLLKVLLSTPRQSLSYVPLLSCGRVYPSLSVVCIVFCIFGIFIVSWASIQMKLLWMNEFMILLSCEVHLWPTFSTGS